MTIPLHSNATYIHSIYIDIANKFTATKPYQFKKSQVVPEEAFNESRGKIRALFIVNENTHDIFQSPHPRSNTAAATPQRPTPSELFLLFSYEDNTMPRQEFFDCISSINISRRRVKYLVDHTASLTVLVIVTKPMLFVLRNQ